MWYELISFLWYINTITSYYSGKFPWNKIGVYHIPILGMMSRNNFLVVTIGAGSGFWAGSHDASNLAGPPVFGPGAPRTAFSPPGSQPPPEPAPGPYSELPGASPDVALVLGLLSKPRPGNRAGSGAGHRTLRPTTRVFWGYRSSPWRPEPGSHPMEKDSLPNPVPELFQALSRNITGAQSSP